MLFFGEGYAEDADAIVARQGEAEAAPATADLEHLHIRLKQELARNVVFLGLLRLFQRQIGPGEIGARVLPVVVEEQVVEL